MPKHYGQPMFCPQMAIEGNPNNPIWIIALNPKTKTDQHKLGEHNPISWITTNENALHFQRLKNILGSDWHEKLFDENGIAHTDIVKCGSPKFTEIEKSAVPFCKEFLFQQIRQYKPKLLLILSSDASQAIQNEANISEDSTEGEWLYGNEENDSCYVIFSGYSAPRQERFARLRLKRDFLSACDRLRSDAQQSGPADSQPASLSDCR